MTAASRPRPFRLLVLAAVAIAGASVLAGCTAGGAPASSASTSATGASTGGSKSAPGGEATATPTPTGGAGALTATPLSVDCSTLAPDATVTATYTGMASVASPVAPEKTDAAVIAAYGGTVCQWKSSDATMTLAVGQFDDDSLTRLKNSLVRTSNAVPTYQGEGYFSLVDTTGTAEAFSGAYWIVAISDTPAFSEPGGAEPLVDSAIAALTARG